MITSLVDHSHQVLWGLGINCRFFDNEQKSKVLLSYEKWALIGVYIRRPNCFWRFHRFTWKSACIFITTSESKIQNLREIRPKLKLQQAKNKFNQPNTAGQPNLVALQPRRAELLQLQFWSDFPEILDLTFWSTNKTTCWFSVESVKFWKTVGFPNIHAVVMIDVENAT